MSTSPLSQKPGRNVGAASSALGIRMDKEFLAIQGHLKKAKNYALAPQRRRSPSGARGVSSTPRRTTSRAKASTEAAYQTRITALEANSKQQQHPYPIPPAVPDNKLRPVEASTSSSQKRGRDVDAASSSALQLRMDEELPVLHDILKKVKPLPPSTSPAADEKKNYAPSPAGRSSTSVPPVLSSTANTTTSQPNAETEFVYQKEREEFRQMLMEMEKSALRDETIYPEDLQELGLSHHWYMS